MNNIIRKLPAVTERVETGPIQFGDDWPMFAIRGDNALNFILQGIKLLQMATANNDPNEFTEILACNSMRGMLLEMTECIINPAIVDSLTTSINNVYNPTQV